MWDLGYSNNLRQNIKFELNTLSYPDKWSRHSHKKRKYSLQTRAILLIFSPELEISGVAVQSIHKNSEK